MSPTDPTAGRPTGTAVPTGGEGSDAPRRRAPYSDNPEVGTKGLRTQQRILDAALQVFGERGYERATLAQVAKVAGCSRVSIYQYFTDKDDVFRHLAGQVARQMRASAEALGPVTADIEGWRSLHAWVGRYADIHHRHQPVFGAFASALESDASLADGSTRAGGRVVAIVQSKLPATALPPRLFDPVSSLLLAAVTRTLEMAADLRQAEPDAYHHERVTTALTDVIHRSLFGPLDGVNGRGPAGPPPGRLAVDPATRAALDRVSAIEQEAAEPGRRALAALLEVADGVVVRRGHRGVRVDDLVEAAGVSHGAYYRYFANRDELVQIVAARALRAVSLALADAPPPGDRSALRRWLRRYGVVHAEQGPVLRVWGGGEGAPGRLDRAAAYDWGRHRMARLLADRPTGDADLDGLVLLAVVETFGAGRRSATDLDAALHVVEHGFLAVSP